MKDELLRQHLPLLQLCLLLSNVGCNLRQQEAPITNEVEFIASVGDASYKPLLVGGCVRDLLLGHNPKDWDVVTSFDPTLAWYELTGNGWAVQTAGLRFQVLHVSKEGETFEIAQFRNDGPYVDGKPAWVKPGTLLQDASRRDFSMNAVYMDPFGHHLFDPTGYGLKDIQSKTLRFVGRPADRLNEDPMRVFRFYRFLAKGFVPIPSHLRAVRMLFGDAYRALAERGPEAVREEIEKLTGANKL